MRTQILTGTAVAIAAVCTIATGAVAQTFEKYGSEAGWEILINEKLGPGCMITRTHEDGPQIQMGVDATTENPRGYMALYTREDAAVSAGEEFSVLFDVDGQEFSGEATGQQMEGFNGAYVWVNNPHFIYDLSEKKMLTITAEGRDPIVIELDGTHAAFEALRTCQEAQQPS